MYPSLTSKDIVRLQYVVECSNSCMTSIWGQPISMICVLEVDDTVGLRLYTYVQQLFYFKTLYAFRSIFIIKKFPAYGK